jgi:hypothetical protein
MHVAQPPAGRNVVFQAPFATRDGSSEDAGIAKPIEFLAVKRSGVLQSSRIDDRAPSECRNREEPLRALRRSLWPVSFATQAATRNCPAPKCRCPLCMWGVTASSNSLRRTSFEAEVKVRLTHGGGGYEGFYLSSEGRFSIREGGLRSQSRCRYVRPLSG